MAVLNVEERLCSRFVCPGPLDAAPGNKGRFVRPLAAVNEPHCQVEIVISTRGQFVDRTSFGTYQGHVPDAPCMLQNNGVYAHGYAATGLCLRRVLSVAAAIVLGAAIGAGFVGVMAVAATVAHILLPAVFGALSTKAVVVLASMAACGAGVAGGVLDNALWSEARRRFHLLDAMDQTAQRFRTGTALAGDDKWANGMFVKHVLGRDFALSQACMELERARQDASSEKFYKAV